MPACAAPAGTAGNRQVHFRPKQTNVRRGGSKCQASRGDAYTAGAELSACGRFLHSLLFAALDLPPHARRRALALFSADAARARRVDCRQQDRSLASVPNDACSTHLLCGPSSAEGQTGSESVAEESSSPGPLMSSHGVGWRSAATPLRW